MRKRRKNKRENEVRKNNDNLNETEQKNKIPVYSQIAAIVIAILTAGYPIVNSIYNMIYQIKCEDYYQIPKKYFNESVNYSLLYLGCIVLVTFAFASPIILKRSEEKRVDTSKLLIGLSILLSLITGMFLGIFNIMNLYIVMHKIYEIGGIGQCIVLWLDYHPYFTIMAVIIAGILSVVGIALVHEIKGLKIKWIRNALLGLLLITLTISSMLMINAVVFQLEVTPEDRIRYEIIVNCDERYVVLSEYEDKVLVVKYEEEGEQIVFYTNEYCFLDKYECTYNYIELKTNPIIISEKVK